MNKKLSIATFCLLLNVFALNTTNNLAGADTKKELMMGWNPTELKNFVYHNGYWFFVC